MYPTASGHHVRPEQAVRPEELLRELLTAEDLPLLFRGRTDLQLGDPKLDLKALPTPIQRFTADRHLRITVPPPQKDELIAYTRLLQKGTQHTGADLGGDEEQKY